MNWSDNQSKKANTNAEGDDNETAINHDSNEDRNESSEDEWDDDAGYTVFHGFESYFREIDSKMGKTNQTILAKGKGVTN